MRFDRVPHVGKRPAFDDRERFEHHAAFTQLTQDFLRAGAGGNFIVTCLDLRPASRAQEQSDSAPSFSRSASAERTVAPGFTTSSTGCVWGPASLMTAVARCQ